MRLLSPPVRWLVPSVLAIALLVLGCVCAAKTKVDMAALKDRVSVEPTTTVETPIATATTQTAIGSNNRNESVTENNPVVDTTTKTTVGIPWYGLTAILGSHGLILAIVIWWFGYRPGNWHKKAQKYKTTRYRDVDGSL